MRPRSSVASICDLREILLSNIATDPHLMTDGAGTEIRALEPRATCLLPYPPASAQPPSDPARELKRLRSQGGAFAVRAHRSKAGVLSSYSNAGSSN